MAFGFWFIMMKPGFIPSDDVIQEVIVFMIVPLQKTGADMLAVALMRFRQMSRYPSSSNFVEPKNVMH